MSDTLDPQTRADLQKIEYWQGVVDEATIERDITIKAAAKRGAYARQIAYVTGLSEGEVGDILRAERVIPKGWLRQRLEREWE